MLNFRSLSFMRFIKALSFLPRSTSNSFSLRCCSSSQAFLNLPSTRSSHSWRYSISSARALWV